MGRKRAFPWRWRILAALALLLAAGALYAWWEAQHWTPSRDEYPTQGALVGARDGSVDFEALRAIGADFVYIEASAGESGRDRLLGENLRALERAEMPFGVVHAYDPCAEAGAQAANFVTVVPRGAGLLPPVIALETAASDCGDPIVAVALESELTTFINQVEGHAGQRAILLLSPGFEAEHDIARRIERPLWLERAFLRPDYAGRPFALWTANPRLSTEATGGALRWVVAQP